MQIGEREGRDHLEDLVFEGRIILKWIHGNRVTGCKLEDRTDGGLS